MSYSPDKFETYDGLKVYRTQFSSSAGSTYPVVSFDVSRQNNRFIPQILIVHYDTLTGNWGSGATYNLGYSAATGYNNYFSSGTLDVSARVTNNMSLIDFSNATANANNKLAISGSQQIVFRWNTTNAIGTITGSVCLVGIESYGS